MPISIEQTELKRPERKPKKRRTDRIQIIFEKTKNSDTYKDFVELCNMLGENPTDFGVSSIVREHLIAIKNALKDGMFIGLDDKGKITAYKTTR